MHAHAKNDTAGEGPGTWISLFCQMMRTAGVRARAVQAPTGSRVRLAQSEPQLLAVRRFSGLATEGEVRRSLAKLRRDVDAAYYAGGAYERCDAATAAGPTPGPEKSQGSQLPRRALLRLATSPRRAP